MRIFFLKHWLTETNVYRVCFLLLCVVLATSLVLPAYPKKMFYIVGYITFLFLITQAIRKKLIMDQTALMVAGPVLLLGIVRVIWARIYVDATFSDVVNNYAQGGKILIISAFISYFLIAWRHHQSPKILWGSICILLAGLLATMGFAISDNVQTHQRIKLLTDSAGTVSYLITALALAALFIVNRVVASRFNQILMFIAIFAINMVLVFLTESRAAVLFLPVLYLLGFYLTHRWAGKFSLIALVVLIAGGLFFMPSSILHRLDNIQNEIGSYQTNNDTSIGARFSIWKGGYHSVNWSILGQSPDARTAKAREYITEHERKNPEAYKNVMYHLHDDFLETLSLQGLAGAITLIIFYFCLVLVAFWRRALDVALLPFSIIIFGLTDTVLIQSSSVFILMSSIIISYTLIASIRK